MRDEAALVYVDALRSAEVETVGAENCDTAVRLAKVRRDLASAQPGTIIRHMLSATVNRNTMNVNDLSAVLFVDDVRALGLDLERSEIGAHLPVQNWANSNPDMSPLVTCIAIIQ